MYTVRKKFRIEMAHQLESAFSKCCVEQIHGHSYIIEVFLRAEKLDDNNMVIDFGELKGSLRPIIEKYDHALVLPRELSDGFLDNPKLITVDQNPTAEWMARQLFKEMTEYSLVCHKLLWKVRVHETESGYAEYERMKL